MWNNIGRKLQLTAKAMLWLGLIGSLLAAIAVWAGDTYPPLFGLVYLVVGSLTSWITSWALYGLGLVVEHVEKGGNTSSQSTADDIAKAIRRNDAAEKERLAAEEKAKIESERKRNEEERKKAQWQEEMKKKKEQGLLIEEEVFLEQIADQDTISKIWQIWQESNLADANPEANQRINYYRDFEKLYGKIARSNVDQIKGEIKAILLRTR